MKCQPHLLRQPRPHRRHPPAHGADAASIYNSNTRFDALNRLVTTNRAGNLTSARAYDRADRLTEYSTYSSPGTLRDRQVSSYNANGWLLQANSHNSSNNLTQQTNYNYSDSYDALSFPGAGFSPSPSRGG